jgi:colanic acid/amylovoran biosynthesis glycosyltransferase
MWKYFLQKRSSRSRLDAFVEIVRLVRQHQPDLIYCHFGNVGEVAIVLRRLFSIPFITFFHGYDFSRLPFEHKADYRELFSRGDWFFANSAFAREKMIQIGCPAAKLSMIGLPIDDTKFVFRINKPGPVIHLLSVGRLVEKKGFRYSIEAAAQIIRQHPEVVYTIIGEGPLRKDLETQIELLGMSNKIVFSGARTQEEVIQYMQSSHIFVLASITASTGDTEGLGMVLLEAQLIGLPVVATRHNGFVDAVSDGKSGYLVAEKDPQALAERINYLIEHPGLWQEMGACGRQHVLENFAENVYMDKLLKKLNDLCCRPES